MDSIWSRASLWLLRVSVVSPSLSPIDVDFNIAAIIAALAEASAKGVQLAVLPELATTGYSCGDFFGQAYLIRASNAALTAIAATTLEGPAVVVGAAVMRAGRLYDCAVMCAGGKITGVVPKINLANRGEFY